MRKRRRSDAVRRAAAKTRGDSTAEMLQRAERQSRQDVFLRQFEASGEIGPSARHAGVHRDTHYEWLKTDPEYAKAFADARIVRIEVLETEVRRRGLVGWDEPVFYQGKQVGSVRKFSDLLLIFALKAEKPEKYRDRVEHSGPGGAPIPLEMIDQARDRLSQLLDRLAKRMTDEGGAPA